MGKPLRKAEERLQLRIAFYQDAIKRSIDGKGRELVRPGSQNRHKTQTLRRTAR